MKKRLIPLLILSILLAVVLAACVPSERTLSTYVVDHTSVWTEAQEETLTQACVQAELTYGIPVIVATSPRSGGEALITIIFDSGFMWAVSVPAAYILTSFTPLGILPVYAICQALNVLKCCIGAAFVKKGKWLKTIVD